MYPNYTSINPNTVPSYQQGRVQASPYMGSNTSMQTMQNVNGTGTDDRFIAGGFLAPFLLGGITGGLLAPAFYGGGGGYGRPVYNTYYYPGQPYYYYGPYYR